ncbi:MAG: hypothetical protein GY870_11335, partial [archaeon]|nr:hypothetical protein [archaeon]
MLINIKIKSVEMDESETLVIVTEGLGEKHTWKMPSSEGKFIAGRGCLEFMDDQEFCKYDLSETESDHYEKANKCFDENAMGLYETKKSEKLKAYDGYFYAESSDELGCDLSRFTDEYERDGFVESVNLADNYA